MIMVFCITFRCEEEAREHQSSQRAVSDELEERQAHCLELRAASEALQGQLLAAEENKKKVSREMSPDSTLIKLAKVSICCKSEYGNYNCM